MTPAKQKILMSWSGGKDSALALFELQKAGEHSVVSLLTTVTEQYERISMHGVRRSLLERQAQSMGLPLEQIRIPPQCVNSEYEARMEAVLAAHLKNGVRQVAFGDIFLEDLRQYREKNLARLGMTGLFPVWKRDTREMVKTFLELGFRAVVVCVDSKVLDSSFAGKPLDEEFLRRLPPNVDPCGENGEFHTFVYDGPIFHQEIPFSPGETVLRDSFYYSDLLPR
jgi:uncharacterized protein (TIGR00290 family)